MDEFRDLPATPAFPIDCEYRVNNLERFLELLWLEPLYFRLWRQKIIISTLHDILKLSDNFWNEARRLVNNLLFGKF
jgi:hypothetical protein